MNIDLTPKLSNNVTGSSDANNCCYSLNIKEKSALLSAMGVDDKKGFLVSLPTPYSSEIEQEEIERLVPFSEAKVFRTSTGFVVRDSHDPEWCKFIPFDDLDKIQTKVAYKTLEPSRIMAMESMPLPSMTPVPSSFLEEYEQEFERVCREERETAKAKLNTIEVHIETMRLGDDDNLYQESSGRLTYDDLVSNQFGTLAPYVNDYVTDTYEVEEEEGTYMPSLSQASTASQSGSSQLKIISHSSEASPLSYQKTVFKDNPYLSEDFESETKTESLICSALSDINQYDEESDRDDLPSSTRLSRFEQEILASKNRIVKTKALRKEPRPTVVIEDLTGWQMLRRSIPGGLVLNSLVSVVLFFLIVIGTFFEVSTPFMFAIYSVFTHYAQKTIRKLKHTGEAFMGLIVEKKTRRLFANKQGIINKASIEVINSTNCFHELNKSCSGSPLDSMVLLKPEGAAASNRKVKRVCHVKPAKISEARVIRLNDDRPYILTRFGNGITRHALLDSGATCSALHPRFLEELQRHGYVPTEETKISNEGCIPKVKETGKKIAYLDFQ